MAKKKSRRRADYNYEGSGEKSASTRTTKKKAAKKKTKKQLLAEAHAPGRLRTTTSMYSRNMMQEFAKKHENPSILVLKDAQAHIVGLACPSLSLEYLFCNTVIPLSLLLQVYGPRGLGKSSFAFEMMRLFRQYEGIGNLFEHESKFNPDWAASVIGYDDLDCLGVIPCDSIEGWEEMLLKTREWVKKVMTGTRAEPGPGRVFPYLQVVDSLMGKPSRETIDKIEKQGYAGRGHPVEALSITRFVTSYAGSFARWPFMLICINHLKESEGEQGKKQHRSGGQTIDFQGSFEIEMRRVSRIRTANVDGNKLQLRSVKNSFGPDMRRIPVNVIWYDVRDPLTGEMRQTTTWDWDSSTVQLILEQVEKKAGARWTKIKEITGLVRDSQMKAHSRTLGFKEPTELFKLGRAIHENADMMNEIRDLLSIRRRKEFQVGVDFEKQLDTTMEELAKNKSMEGFKDV